MRQATPEQIVAFLTGQKMDIVARLRSLNEGNRWPMMDEAADRIERLEEALERIEQWSCAYPLTVFPEPDLKRARELLEAGGMTLDSISAHAMRHVVEGVGEIASRALKPKP